jgi:hypothetical protein
MDQLKWKTSSGLGLTSSEGRRCIGMIKNIYAIRGEAGSFNTGRGYDFCSQWKPTIEAAIDILKKAVSPSDYIESYEVIKRTSNQDPGEVVDFPELKSKLKNHGFKILEGS